MAARERGIAADTRDIGKEIAPKLRRCRLVARRAALLPRLAVDDLVDQRAPGDGVFHRQAEVVARVEAEHAVRVIPIGIEATLRQQGHEHLTRERTKARLVRTRPLGGVVAPHHAAPLAVRGRIHGGEGVGNGLAEEELRGQRAGRPGDVGLVVHAGVPHVLKARERPGVVLRHEVRPALGAHGRVERKRIPHRLIGEGIVMDRHGGLRCACAAREAREGLRNCGC